MTDKNLEQEKLSVSGQELFNEIYNTMVTDKHFKRRSFAAFGGVLAAGVGIGVGITKLVSHFAGR